MASHSNRVFSTTVARESFSNYLASVSPVVANSEAFNFNAQISTPAGWDSMNWIDDSGLSLSTTSGDASATMIPIKTEQMYGYHQHDNMATSTTVNVQEQLMIAPQFSINQASMLKQARKRERPSLVMNPPIRKRPRTSSNSTSATQRSPGEKSRYDTSLGLLTKKFIQLMNESQDGVLDLNHAASVLSVQKRRIYDITNVLEGIRLIEKRSKNNVQWTTPNSNATDSTKNEMQQCKHELLKLDEHEDQLDELIKQRHTELEQLSDSNTLLSFVTYQDIRGIKSFQDDIVICIKAPQDTKLEVPDPEEKIQMLLKSTKGEIEVFLCPDPNDALPPSPSDSTPESCSESTPITDVSERLSQGSSSPSRVEYKTVLKTERGVSPTLKHPVKSMRASGESEIDVDSAFIEEDSASFIALSPVVHPDDYLFTLDDSEGISELFDMNATALPNGDLRPPKS